MSLSHMFELMQELDLIYTGIRGFEKLERLKISFISDFGERFDYMEHHNYLTIRPKGLQKATLYFYVWSYTDVECRLISWLKYENITTNCQLPKLVSVDLDMDDL